MNFNNLRLATKLWVSTGLIILALLFVIGFAAGRSAKDRAESGVVLEAASAKIKMANQWASLTEVNAARSLAVTLSSEPSLSEAFKEDMASTSARISEIQKKVEDLPLKDEDRAQLARILDARKMVLDLRAKGTQLKADNKLPEFTALLNSQYKPALAAYQQAQKDFVTLQEAHFEESRLYFVGRQKELVMIASAVALLVILGIIIGASLLIKSIRAPLMQANRLAARIAKGDLGRHMEVTRGDEFGDLMRSLSSMNDSLGQMVAQVRNSTDGIALASTEIANGNSDLAHRTEEASSNLQATASSMDELTSTVQQSADNARQASALAVNASAVARKGGEVVEQVVVTMEEINASSKKIADIIGVIDGIAFQTNILALNAAVEAARAGEQGRGFAVVASEVRSLAQRSAEAAKEIKGLIGTSVDKVASGAKLVADAGVTMREIVESVKRVAEVIGEITAASAEQSAGIAQVNNAIGNLDQMTQQNAALVEQSAAAAEGLREESAQMAQAVSVFKLHEGNRPLAIAAG